MEEVVEEGFRIKNKNGKTGGPGGGEVDYKSKSGTAWSHSYLNQKPWHPLSYPNQRRKWIAEQTHATHERRAQEVAREYAQEQEFFRQTALVSAKEKEKLEVMKAVSFMYVRPPGYNAESAKAAEVADSDPKKKDKPRDVFGRSVPTEEEFQALKNAPRLDTGVAGRAKPFGVEIRNVKCLRCGAHGHQSGDRECPLKDVIMPNEETRLRRDDPLTAILVHTDPSEPLKWELKQKPGISPPRGGFKPDDPNQQIVAEDIFDEYGGFLGEGNIPELLTSFSSKPKKKSRKKSRHRSHQSSPNGEFEGEFSSSSSSTDEDSRSQKRKHKKKKKQKEQEKRRDYSASSSSDVSESYKCSRSKYKHRSSEKPEASRHDSSTKNRRRRSHSSEGSDDHRLRRPLPAKDSESERRYHDQKRNANSLRYSSRHSERDGQSTSKGKEKHRSHSGHQDRYSYRYS